MDLNRLRELAQEPPREAMSRSHQFPSMTDKVLAQRAEIDALRRGLSDAITEIELVRRQVAEFTQLLVVYEASKAHSYMPEVPHECPLCQAIELALGHS